MLKVCWRKQINKLVIGRQISRAAATLLVSIFHSIRSECISIVKLAHLTALNLIRPHSLIVYNVLIHHSFGTTQWPRVRFVPFTERTFRLLRVPSLPGHMIPRRLVRALSNFSVTLWLYLI